MKHCYYTILILLNSLNIQARCLNYAIPIGNHNYLKNTSFFCPIIDDDDLNLIPSTCNSSDGQILGIRGTGTGNLRFTWKNVNGHIMGTEADLKGVPTGFYTVELADDSKCKVVVSTQYYVGVKNQITIDNSNIIINKPSCNNADGSITGIIVNNAVQYQWINSSGQTVATTTDLNKAVADNYTLVATNTTGCSAKSSYSIPSATSNPKILHSEVIDAGCNSRGAVNVTFDIHATDPPYRYALQINGTDRDLQTGYVLFRPDSATLIRLDTLSAGLVYNLYTLDGTNCRTKVASYTVKASSGYSIGIENAIIHPDVCGQHVGFILGLSINGGAKPDPKKQPKEGYFWKDSKGNPIPQGTLYLESVGAGTYTLTVKNGDGCYATRTFVIKDSTSVAIPPEIDNIAVCLPQSINITVKNSNNVGVTGYRIYDSTGNLLRQSKYGHFAEKVSQTTKFYVSALKGTCESPKTEVNISVALSNVMIPNTFTPNQDGVNDFWNIAGLIQYPNTEIFIYNRYGLLVYHSINYAKPFDGTYNGKILPEGVYYYTLDVKKSVCMGKISGSLTLIR